VPLLRLMRSTLSQTLPQNWRIVVDNHANLFGAVHSKIGRNCRRQRCEYFAPVLGGSFNLLRCTKRWDSLKKLDATFWKVEFFNYYFRIQRYSYRNYFVNENVKFRFSTTNFEVLRTSFPVTLFFFRHVTSHWRQRKWKTCLRPLLPSGWAGHLAEKLRSRSRKMSWPIYCHVINGFGAWYVVIALT
jgi:hypothetical protein